MNPAGLALMLAVIVGTMGFEGLVAGQDIIQQSFPQLLAVNFGSCAPSGGNLFQKIWDSGFGLGTLSCVGAQVFFVFADVFIFLFGCFVLIGNLVSFNVPGAPVIVRAIVGTFFGFAITLTGVLVVRGNG